MSEKRKKMEKHALCDTVNHDTGCAYVVNLTVYLIYLNHVNKFIKYVITRLRAYTPILQPLPNPHTDFYAREYSNILYTSYILQCSTSLGPSTFSPFPIFGSLRLSLSLCDSFSACKFPFLSRFFSEN